MEPPERKRAVLSYRDVVMNTIPFTQPPAISSAIFSALAAHDVEAAHRFQAIYVEPLDQSVQGQMRSANQFWRMQLALSPYSTIGTREYLAENCAANDWIRLFAQHVAPVVAALSLPAPLAPVGQLTA